MADVIKEWWDTKEVYRIAFYNILETRNPELYKLSDDFENNLDHLVKLPFYKSKSKLIKQLSTLSDKIKQDLHLSNPDDCTFGLSTLKNLFDLFDLFDLFNLINEVINNIDAAIMKLTGQDSTMSINEDNSSTWRDDGTEPISTVIHCDDSNIEKNLFYTLALIIQIKEHVFMPKKGQGSEANKTFINDSISRLDYIIGRIINIKKIGIIAADITILEDIKSAIRALNYGIDNSVYTKVTKFLDWRRKGGKVCKKSTIRKSRISNKNLGGGYFTYYRSRGITDIDTDFLNGIIFTINGIISTPGAIGNTVNSVSRFIGNKINENHSKPLIALNYLKNIILHYSKIHNIEGIDQNKSTGGMYINRCKNNNTRKIQKRTTRTKNGK